MNYDQFQQLFELICESLEEQEGKVQLGFKGAMESDGPDGVVMTFLFQGVALAIRFPKDLFRAQKSSLKAEDLMDFQDRLRGAKGGFSDLFSDSK